MATEANARKQLTSVKLGENLTSDFGFDEITGMINSIHSYNKGNSGPLTLQDLAYKWDVMGNLEQRSDLEKSLEENFEYDDLNRLTDIYLGDIHTDEVVYDEFGSGNITDKMGVGHYVYEQTGGTGPHAVTKISGDLEEISPDDQHIDYTSFDKVCMIREGNSEIRISYGIGHQRKIQVLGDGTDVITKTYIGEPMRR